MKNLKLLAAAVAVILAGCAQTPDSVRSSAEKDSKERNEITAIQYISSNKLSDDIDNALDKSYTQFDLRENISVKLPEDYCEVDFTQISDYEENYEKIMTRIFGKDVLDRENTVHDETGDGMVSYSFSDDDGKMYGCVKITALSVLPSPQLLMISLTAETESRSIILTEMTIFQTAMNWTELQSRSSRQLILLRTGSIRTMPILNLTWR